MPKVREEMLVMAPAEPLSLVDRIKAQRALLSRKYHARVSELDRAERLLTDSDAEGLVAKAEQVLARGEEI